MLTPTMELSKRERTGHQGRLPHPEFVAVATAHVQGAGQERKHLEFGARVEGCW